jgi:acyl carrier protein
VPIGVPGQLCVGGHGLARGYLGRAKETADKFVSDPFRPESRLYLTGDRARYRRDGNIEYLGRMDRRLKIRGFRVELGEIESSLREHPSVQQAVVTARGDSNGERRLVAYFVQSPPVGDERERPETAGAVVPQLRRFLQERLPDYMVPAEFVVLKSFPLTPSGKIDCRALPEPAVARAELARTDVEPQTPTEHVIRDIWREVLHVENAGMHDNFFDLGGHSLLLAAVHSKLAKAFAREIRSTDLYQYPTIGSLASHLNDEGVEQRPLSPLQERARKRKEAVLQRQSRVEARIG